MDDTKLKRAYRNGWFLLMLAILVSVILFNFVVLTNLPGKEPTWDMGGKPFVPASSPYANGYYEPPATPERTAP